MRNPPRKAAIFASLLALGLLLAWLGANSHVPLDSDWVPGSMVAAGGLVAFASSLWLIQALFHMRGMAQLQTGIGVVARWHVGAIDWEKYRLADDARALSDAHHLVNDLWIRKTTPPEGVEVIVGRKALIIDGSYHVLRMNGLPELRAIGWLDNAATPGRPPDCLEFLLAYPRGKHGGIRHTCLRVPVPAAALEEGRKTYDQFAPALERRNAKGSIALRNPRRTLQVCGAILLASAAAAGWGWLAANRTGWSFNETITPLVLLIAGAMGALFAVVLGALTLLLRPRRR